MHTTLVTIVDKHKHLASKARICHIKTKCSDITRAVTNDLCRFNQCFSVISDLFLVYEVFKCLYYIIFSLLWTHFDFSSPKMYQTSSIHFNSCPVIDEWLQLEIKQKNGGQNTNVSMTEINAKKGSLKKIFGNLKIISEIAASFSGLPSSSNWITKKSYIHFLGHQVTCIVYPAYLSSMTPQYDCCGGGT